MYLIVVAQVYDFVHFKSWDNGHYDSKFGVFSQLQAELDNSTLPNATSQYSMIRDILVLCYIGQLENMFTIWPASVKYTAAERAETPLHASARIAYINTEWFLTVKMV